MMRAVLAAVLATAVILPATVATAGPIEDRKAIMKGNGRDTKMGGDMLKGVAPFDAATAIKILANYAAAAKAFPGAAAPLSTAFEAPGTTGVGFGALRMYRNRASETQPRPKKRFLRSMES